MMKRRILIVDDEIGMARALAWYLSENGDCDVRVENVGSRTLASAREFRPALIVMDVVMPDADGATLAAQIQADAVLQTTPIVFLTGLASQHEECGGPTRIAGLPFLPKPIDPDAVLAYIEQHATAP